MRDWLTAREIAEEQLPELPKTESAIIRLAKREGWNAHPCYVRDRAAVGGGLEYNYRLLPTLAQVTYVQRHMVVGLETATPEASTEIVAPATVSNRAAMERDARLAVLGAFDRFARGMRLHQRACMQIFCDRYGMGMIKVDDWVKDLVPSVSKRSLARWRSLKTNGADHALAIDRSKARAGTGVLDTANDGLVRKFLLALVAKAPQLAASEVRTQCRYEFGDTLEVVSKGLRKTIELPPIRTFQHFLKALKETHAVELTKLTNPDKFRSTMALSGVGTLRHITEPNALWQIDASPVDALCTDGRHSIYCCIDIATRRSIWYVSRTPRASAVALLMRKAILAMGSPDAVKTDNGSDFVSRDIKRLFASVAIEAVVSDAYSPEQKGHVERMIKTFQHKFAVLLPGYVGHSVADRKAIEDRKSFAARLGEDDAETFGVSLSGAELQEAVDRWAETMYAHEPHAGLGGRTPFQVAASSTTPIRTIDERALDVLLMPAVGNDGRRTVTKFGIRIDHRHYLAASILPGTEVFVRRDPNDMGRVHAFSLDGGTYLGEALCPELAGVHPETWVKAQKELRAEIIRDKTAEIRKGMREINKGPALHERALAVAARDIPNVVALPKREERHQTPQIAAALDVGTSRKRVEPVATDAQREIVLADLAPQRAFENVTPIRSDPTPAQRFRNALDIEQRHTAGEHVDAEQLIWFGSYRESAEYKAQRAMWEDFGDQAPGLRT
ncbi:DDE-type integrase/transposase/recombinase [Shinella zoogloeoides]|uniref:DDE-type integrase/transposase/recombinase n=1 Tax=Shinella zoogloeoides TaxID=352475 RepID=A0A6N8T8W4_SHIZO|nr:DDE-type integrase/transposase/recombinase [Shinella zoogloeoides]MXN99408.1 DDE-type integrase/transposase/recombinase [Shinella zoogloeoides]UEX82813.1 DDE-type integrase/transposase/recombinase [Shinella zoogloeoides]